MSTNTQIETDPMMVREVSSQADATDAPRKSYKRVVRPGNYQPPKLDEAILKMDRYCGMPARQRRLLLASLLNDLWTSAWHEGYKTAEQAYGDGRNT